MTEFESRVAFIVEDWVERLPNDHGVLRLNLGKRFPYHIIYQAKEDTIEIVAFGHNRQRDAFWVDRLD